MDFLSTYYDWLKAFHVISVIAWMAGLFYLPRLFVYHAEQAAPGSEFSEILKIMERRLYRGIMNPAMGAAWLFGGLMLTSLGWDGLAVSAWLQVKLVLVIAMSAYHVALGRWLRGFAADMNTHEGKFFRYINEIPTVLMIGIVIMAIAEPF